jgi:hypothetical protein
MSDAPDDVPDEVVAQAKAAFVRRGPGEIAVLTWDSLLDEDAPAGDHKLRFEHPELQIEVRLFTTAGSADLEGRIQPPRPLQVDLLGEQGNTLRTTRASDGIFAFEHLSRQTVQLCVQTTTAQEIRTDWFRL